MRVDRRALASINAGAMLVQCTFPGGVADPAMLAALHEHGWSTLHAGAVAARIADSLDAAQADFREATGLDHGHVRWSSPDKRGAVPTPPPPAPRPVVRRRLPAHQR